MQSVAQTFVRRISERIERKSSSFSERTMRSREKDDM